ncbi:MAG: alpha-D-ribose 1-methylphosphonate 5-triphosphate diphosphatase [Alphaproteobacteria bacterium]|nr:alpha-D-ribose 1-methylphosphonate 5-triphosphate diphosphatase [Alphaproteobacteria bacterium]
MDSSFAIAGGRTLLPEGLVEDGRIVVEGAAISAIGDAPAPRRWDAGGLLVLPAIVDLHGDAFERQIMPRPGVSFALDLALADTDRQLVSNGIATAYHAVTWSWEPGLRSERVAHAFAEALRRLRPILAADARLHLRWETFALDAVPVLEGWLAAGGLDLLALNDHTPEMLRRSENPSDLLRYVERTGLAPDAFRALVGSVWERRDEVPAAVERLAGRAGAHGVPLASHDDDSPQTRRKYHALGCRLCEFPKTVDTAREARATGSHVIMGAPNVVRGGSHLKATSAAALVRERLCNVLTSDYYYPSLLHAPFVLARDGYASFAEAWALVSANPAVAAGLSDRGAIAAGKRADIVLVDDRGPGLPRVVALFVAGKPVYLERDALPRAA